VLRAFAGRSSLPTYLTVVARRVAVRGVLRTLESGHVPAAAAAPPRRDATAHAVDREEVEALLAHLADDEARLVRLHHLEARSYGEISRITGMPLGSIGPALSRAREKMKAHAQ
jgi:RNA polymerase sigma-70 factor (ECF subfamily)